MLMCNRKHTQFTQCNTGCSLQDIVQLGSTFPPLLQPGGQTLRFLSTLWHLRNIYICVFQLPCMFCSQQSMVSRTTARCTSLMAPLLTAQAHVPCDVTTLCRSTLMRTSFSMSGRSAGLRIGGVGIVRLVKHLCVPGVWHRSLCLTMSIEGLQALPFFQGECFRIGFTQGARKGSRGE